MEQAKANDVAASGLIARPASSEGARAMGKFTFECYDKDGKLKWTAESKNLVVNVGFSIWLARHLMVLPQGLLLGILVFTVQVLLTLRQLPIR